MKPGMPGYWDRAWVDELAEGARTAGEEIPAALELAGTYGRLLPVPGHGQTERRWAVLAEVARVNLTVARVFEAHTDALAILAEAQMAEADDRNLTYGVFAAEGSAEPLRAISGRRHDNDLVLDGVKPWCSLGTQLDVGLVTAHVGAVRQLFRVDLHHSSVSAEPTSGWVARGLRTVTSTALRFDGTPAAPVGDLNWYLKRPGFSWGGMGVAACWLGGAQGLQQRLAERVRQPLSELSALHLGVVDVALHSASSVLAQAAIDVDNGDATGARGELLAFRVRAVVADAVERTLREVGHALGPAPLAFDEDHARRVADLELYVRQHHGERDLAALGQALIAGDLGDLGA